MGLINKDLFVCIDCETTGLDVDNDRIIEVGAATFTFEKVLDRFETLIDPECDIPAASQEIHRISNDMIKGKPKIVEVLPTILKLIDEHIIVGHGVLFDITLISKAAERCQMPCKLHTLKYIDTLRMARLYGESPTNSLEQLRRHFNIEPDRAHRAMSDVLVNIEVFKKLASYYKTTQELLQRLERPIILKAMPLGKHKGRHFDEIPLAYLQWAANQDFDQDLLYSIRTELKKRQKGHNFEQASNPFSNL
jgi:DNA polymerase III subunit epsilon